MPLLVPVDILWGAGNRNPHHVNEHGEVLIGVRFELLRIQSGAESREAGNVRKQQSRREPLCADVRVVGGRAKRSKDETTD